MEWHWWGVDFCPRQGWSGHRKQQFISWWPEVCFDLPWKFSRQIVYRSPRIHPVQQSYVSDHLHEQSSLGWCPSLCQSGAWKKEGRHEDSRSCSGKIRNFSTYLIRSQKTKLQLVLVIQPDEKWGNQQNWQHCSSGKDLNVCNKSCAEASQRRWHSNQSMAKKGELSIYCIFVLCPSTA